MARVPTKPARPRTRATVPDSVSSKPIRKPDARQAALPLDPMPPWQEPCLAQLKDKPPVGARWAFEIKWDGYRVSLRVERGKATILTRRGHDWTLRFPSIAEAAEDRFRGRTLILDGEAVVLDEKGRPSFGLLQQALGTRGNSRNPGSKAADEALLFAFDVLYLDGRDMRDMPLSDRREHLEDLVGSTGVIRLSQEIEGDGAALLRHACSHGLEGIIAKDRNAPYRSGRNGDWLKIKCKQSETFAVVGYEASENRRGAIARLLLAARDGKQFVYVGGVGTGWTLDQAYGFRAMLDKLPKAPALPGSEGKNRVYVKPTLAAEIEFGEWTSDNRLRHPSFKGFREKADNAKVFDMKDKPL